MYLWASGDPNNVALQTLQKFCQAWLWTHKLHQNNLAWNSEQLQITTQERQDGITAP